MEADRHVLATFDDKIKAQNAIDALIDKGFDTDSLSLMVSDDGKKHHFEVDKNKSKTAEGVSYGAALGALVGGLGAIGAGLVSVAIPGAILVSGPLASALVAGTTAAAVGGLAGGLVGVGIPSDEVELVESEIGSGNIIVAAHSLGNENEATAKKVFKNYGAVRIH